MRITIESKFEIGEIVSVKGAEQRLLINNIVSETCCGGTQILYKGIMLCPDPRHGANFLREGEKEKYFMDKDILINEMMLEKLRV